MTDFFVGIWHLVKYIAGATWSHHPTTWQSWAYSAYMLIITIGLFIVVFGKKLPTSILLFGGLAAIITGIGAATQQDAFRFWGWLAIGLILLVRPIRESSARRKLARAKKVKPAQKAPAKTP